MVITHIQKNEEINLRVDYTQLLGDWVEPLKEYLHTEYHSNLMFDIQIIVAFLDLHISLSITHHLKMRRNIYFVFFSFSLYSEIYLIYIAN